MFTNITSDDILPVVEGVLEETLGIPMSQRICEAAVRKCKDNGIPDDMIVPLVITLVAQFAAACRELSLIRAVQIGQLRLGTDTEEVRAQAKECYDKVTRMEHNLRIDF